MQVFDFDKTLTERDTLAGFYKTVTNNKFKYSFKRILIICAAIIYKLKIIDNTGLKKLGVLIFLKGLHRDQILAASGQYAASIVLNDVYYNQFLKVPKSERCIISASFIDYLQLVFPGELVFGSLLLYSNQKVKGLLLNMYAGNKVSPLVESGIKRIECLYTDSMTDKPLMDISDSVYIVSNGRIFLHS